MSQEEPRRVSLPSRLSDAPPASGLYARPERFEAPGPPEPPRLSARRGSAWEWMGRAVRRHWWQILPLWLVASGLIWFLVPRWFPNSYLAFTEPLAHAGAQGATRGQGTDFDPLTFKETQAQRIVSPNVVGAALANNPELGRDLVTVEQPNSEVAILDGLSAELKPRTHLIRVAMRATRDAALNRIVDSVVDTYLNVATEFNQEGALQLRMGQKQLLNAKTSQRDAKRKEVAEMVRANGNIDPGQGKARHDEAIARHGDLTKQLLATDLEVVGEQARLEQVRQAEAEAAARPRLAVTATSDLDVRRAFYGVPEVAALKAQQDQAKQGLARAERDAGKVSDATRRTAQARIDDFQKQIDQLWGKLSPGLIIAARPEEATAEPVVESNRIETNLKGLKARQALLTERLDAVKRETLVGGADVLKLEFARQDLDRAETVLKSMTQSFQDVEVRTGQPVARFHKEYPAKTVEQSAARWRWAVGVAAPALILLGLLGFFGLIERQVGRILDPSDLPSKARLHVIGMVPPLPKPRNARLSLNSAKGQRSQVDLERFIQSLDQLRVLVCGRDGQGRPRRSLLITSAGENEGKSTLAAQLAERSVNAGLLTLLIDADLRNPSLSRMFDRPESVGLANVLRGELLAEEAIGTVTEAGGFHFLSAGQVRDDLSRLLASDRLARLLESARESFDLVLVDSPPVLPVADALTIGQWVDGAVLTVRHKISRLPLVERAAQQLASVGVTVLGAVVSGVRDRYAPYYGPKPAADADRSAAVDAVL